MSNPTLQSNQHAPSAPQPPSVPRSKVRRRIVKVLTGLLLLVLLALAVAPTILAKTAFRNRIARQLTSDLNGTLEIGSASVGWFTAIELRDVTLTDCHGEVIARIPAITSSKSLFGLLRDRTKLGEFTLHNPTVEVICDKQSSNLEEVLHKYLEDDLTPRRPTRPEVTLRVVGGTLTLRTPDTRTPGVLHNLEAVVQVPAARSDSVAVDLNADAPGPLRAEIRAGGSSRAKIAANGVALESLAVLLHRFEPELDLAGSFTADVTATWDKEVISIEGTLGGKNIALSGPWLNGDRLRLVTAELPLKLKVAGRRLQVERAQLTSDLGTISAAGSIDFAEALVVFFDRPGTKLDADIDLAKLAATLPKSLRMRECTELRDGKLIVKVESRSTPQGTTWTGKLNSTSLRAMRDGREVRWEEPISIEFAGRYRPKHMPTFDTLICRSEFAAIQAEVLPDSFRAAANFDLDKLATRLADFVDLEGTMLGGRGTLSVVARRDADKAFKAEASLELKQFAFARPQGKSLKEPQLSLHVSASGQAPDGGAISVAAGRATLTSGSDECQLTLVEAIVDVERPSSGKIDAQLTGDLGRWWSRIGSFIHLPEKYILGGMATAKGSVRFATNMIAIDRLSLILANARFRGAGLDLDEEQMDAVADLTIDRESGTTTFARFTINSLPLSVANGQLIIQTPPKGGLTVEGGGPAVVGMARLGKTLQLFADPRGPQSIHGRGAGPIRFRYADGTTTFGGKLDVTNLSVGLPTAPDWTEPALRLEADGSYVESTDSLNFTAAKIERPGFALSANASMERLGTSSDLKLNGTVGYDLEKLSPKLREVLGGGFTALGKGTTPISLTGSLSPAMSERAGKSPPGSFAAMNGGLRIDWTSLRAYGFDVGPSRLNATLTKGVCLVDPITAKFGGGKVNLQPTLHLEVEPGYVTFAKGSLIERATLTPAVCAEALGYALPAIARSGKSEGEISVFLFESRIPFADANKAAVKGRITIHHATVAPGPVLAEIAKLLGANNVAMTVAKDTIVPIQVENGTVHHQNFAVQIGGSMVITSGSVGFDGKLNLIADVPIPSGLLKGSPLAAKALAGKRVKVPIAGTLSKPMLDPRQLQAAIVKLSQDAGKDIGKELLNKELQKLFPPMVGPKK